MKNITTKTIATPAPTITVTADIPLYDGVETVTVHTKTHDVVKAINNWLNTVWDEVGLREINRETLHGLKYHDFIGNFDGTVGFAIETLGLDEDLQPLPVWAHVTWQLSE